jgi:hypothetical protein
MGRHLALAVLVLVLAPLALGMLSVATAVVRAQTAPAVVLGAGRPVTLEATFTVSPGDAIASHLYTWYFDGVNDYVVIPLTVYDWSAITIQEWIYPFHPKANAAWSKFNMIGDYWANFPSIFYGTNNRYDYTGLSLLFVTRRPDGTQRFYSYNLFAYRNSWVNLANRFSLLDRVLAGYINGVRVYSATIPSTEHTILEWNPNTATYPWMYRRFVLGANTNGSENMRMMQANILIFSQSLSDSEIYNTYAYNIVNSSGLAVFLDPTFYNGTHFLDLSGNNRHGIGYNGVTRAVDSRTWLYLIKQRFSDGYVHFMFFPLNSVVYIYDSSGNLVTSFIITGSANVAGLVHDYPVFLPTGTYRIVVYTYQDYTIFQNSGSTYTRLVARYAPGSQLRLMVNATSNIQAIRYQIATDSGFSNILYDNTVATSNSFIDITLPSINNTYYLRVAVQFTDGTWSLWSNTYQFRVDWLTARIIASSNVFPAGSAPSILFNVTYTDRSYPYVPNIRLLNVTVAALGKYNLTSYWWRVDVYRGATTVAEPPNPSYYTYLGTVYTIHPYFNSYYYWDSIPSTYVASYIPRG